MRPRGLGRGLGALIPTAPPTPATGGEVGTGTDAAAATAAIASSPASDTVRAVDRWLWRQDADALPGGSPVDPLAADVPRGTSSDRPTGLAAAGATFAELDPARVRPNPRQPRQLFDPEDLEDLVASIREVGLLQPVVVRPLDATSRTGAGQDIGQDIGQGADVEYELVMGERRWRAALAAGLPRLPAIIRPTGDDQLLRDALLENIQRVALNPLEEAAAYQQLLTDFACTQDELSRRLGRSRPQLANTLRLLRLSPPVQRRVAAGVLSAGHAKALLGLADPADQERLAARAVAEGLSVRTVEELVGAGGPGRSEAARAAGGRARTPTAAYDAEPVAQRLGDRLDTRVTVTRRRGGGRLVVQFGSAQDLARIADLIDPPASSPA